jgi:hypothetical protein
MSWSNGTNSSGKISAPPPFNTLNFLTYIYLGTYANVPLQCLLRSGLCAMSEAESAPFAASVGVCQMPAGEGRIQEGQHDHGGRQRWSEVGHVCWKAAQGRCRYGGADGIQVAGVEGAFSYF